MQCKGQIRLYKSFMKHGYESHSFSVIEECDLLLLNDRERYWQDFYDASGDMGLNCLLTSSKDKTGGHSDATKQKISKANKAVFIKKNGIGAITKRDAKAALRKLNLDKLPISDESRSKMRTSKKGNKLNFGRKLTKEEKQKISDGNPRKKEIINLETGIFYSSATEAAFSYGGHPSYLLQKITNSRYNDTPFLLLSNCSDQKGQLVLNSETGIFYISIKEAAKTFNLNQVTLRCKIRGIRKNNTSFLLV